MYYSEWGAGFRNNGDGDGGANSHLALLHLEIVQQCVEHILRTHCLGDVAKCVHCCSPDRLLVRLQHV